MKYLLILVILLTPTYSLLLQRGFFPVHDNLQPMRQLQMEKCFSDGQIPCRWVPDMGNGYGYPLFNYYPPLPYLLGQVFRIANFSFIDTIKAVGVTGFVLGGLGMYYLAKEIWGKKAGLISAILFSYAPYHSVDYFVRGAVNEFWAMTAYPLIFFLFLKLIKSSRPIYVPFCAISLAVLMLSHNLMLMIFIPFFVLWITYWLTTYPKKNSLIFVIASGLLGISISAFFNIPVLFEQKLVHIETLTIGYFNYLAHFADIKQLFFETNWGYGGSSLGHNDGLSFALGYVQSAAALGGLLFGIFIKKISADRKIIFGLFISLLLSLFMTHSRSSFIWDHIRPLQFLQFPWRFLTIAVFFAGLLGGVIAKINSKISIVLIVICLMVNGNYFRPSEWYFDQNDSQMFSGDSWKKLITASIFDYLPISATLPPVNTVTSPIVSLKEPIFIEELAQKTNKEEYKIVSSHSTEIKFNKLYFPYWTVSVNNQPAELKITPDEGTFSTTIPSGTNYIQLKLQNTPIRHVANILSVVGIFVSVFWIVAAKWSKISNVWKLKLR